jgi:flagellar hook-associated protein 2
MPEGFDLGLSGLASNFDWRSLVDQLVEVERAPQRRLRTEQTAIDQRKNAYSSIITQLGVLRNRVTALKESALFASRTTATSDATVASATASGEVPLGSYVFAITQLAAAAIKEGTANVGSPLSATNDVSGVVLGNAAFATPVTAGTFTINGKQVTIATTDTLQAVFDKIGSATGGDVTASYDATSDKITLSSASSNEIILGSATDTSNFLTVAKLSNNGTGSIASSAALGAVRISGVLSSANLTTPIDDGGSGQGKFKINGVEITFDASADSISDVLKRINDSSAGVTATYDSVNDRFRLTNKTTGDVGIALEDVSGNFLVASGLAGGGFQRGKDLLYTINGGGQLNSHSNTITKDSSGIDGLAVTALKEAASVTVTVGADTARIKAAINDFITEYNKTQSLIDTNTASSTDAKGKVTAGTLAGENDANSLASALRRLVTAQVSGLSGTFKQLENIGIASNGNDNNLAVSDSDKLDDALTSDLTSVKELFSNSINGLAAQLDDYLEKTVGDDGTLLAKQDNLSKQSADIDTQISDQERLVQANREQLIASFLAMEQAQGRINQQLQFLSQHFGGTQTG